MRPCSGLPAARRSRRRLEAVIGRIAHHMGERILDQVEHLAVELGLGALHFQLDLLAEFVGQIAHDARQLLPGIADRLHARLHDAFLQLGGDVGQPLQRRLEFRILVAAHDLEQLIARQHQLRHHGHQVFERIDGDADRLVGDLARLSSSLAGFGSARLWRHSRRGGSTGVSRKARSRSSSESSPGRSGRSSTCGASVPTAYCRRRAAQSAARARSTMRSSSAIRSLVGAFRLALLALELFENLLDAVDGGEDERDGFAGRRHAVAELAHQRFGGVRQRFQPRQAEKAAGALDGVDEAENVVEDLGVVGILLETHELDVDDVETLVRLGQEFPQQIVHEKRLRRQALARLPLSVGSAASVSVKRLILVAVSRNGRAALTFR